MAHMLETPSRIIRRIKAVEGDDMPSLPSMPTIEDSAFSDEVELSQDSLPVQSTPSVGYSRVNSTVRPPSSVSSTARFANSITTRSTRSGKSSISVSRFTPGRMSQLSFDDVSAIPTLPDASRREHMTVDDDLDLDFSKSNAPNSYLPPELPDPTDESDDVEDRDMSMVDALCSVSSRSSTPPLPEPEPELDATPRKKSYDYSVSVRTEAKPSPFDKFRNVAVRKPLARTRTPSLTHTTPSPASSPDATTPQSTRSYGHPFARFASPSQYRASAPSPLPAAAVPLPRSRTASPALTPRRAQPHNGGDKSADSPSVQALVSQSTIEGQSDEELMHSPELQGPGGQPLPEDVDETEPTFSSEGTPAPTLGSPATVRGYASPGPMSIPMSSPAPSVMFTPTPAFQPRPRARFNAYPATPPAIQEDEESSSKTNQESELEDESTEREPHSQQVRFDDEPATPFTRRRSFLLSVIHSTARPRMKMGTPHPAKVADAAAEPSSPESAGDVQDTPAPGAAAARPTVAATPGITLANAFSGITPHPRPRARPRLSHPLAQAWTAGAPMANATPGPASTVSAHTPDGSPGERPSFASSASSHDLTTHARANASFDPVVGLGAQGHGVGRFNAGKLNSYLHGLNRRLQQENEALLVRLSKLEAERTSLLEAANTSGSVAGNTRRSRRSSSGSAGVRRLSAGRSELDDVAEWGEEKQAFEEQLEELKQEVERAAGDRDEVQRAYEEALLEREALRKDLDDEREHLKKLRQALVEEEGARNEDRDKYKTKVRELEKGVEAIVQQLEQKAEEAEAKIRKLEEEKARAQRDFDKMLAELEGERNFANERAEKAEMALESGRELGTELKEANERVAQVMTELRGATAQIKDLEDEVMRSDEKVHALEQDAQSSKQTISTLEDDVQKKWDELADARVELETAAKERAVMEEQLAKANTCISELEEDAGAALGRIQTLEEQLVTTETKLQSAEDEVQEATERADNLEADAERANELARQMEEALKATESRMHEDQEEIAALKAKIVALERDVDRDRTISRVVPDHNAEVEALEAELDDAHREIARLAAQASQRPARAAIDHAKDVKIEHLEKEKAELLERIQNLKSASISAFNTPSKPLNLTGISPAHRHVLNMSLRAPKTPGGPLKDLSWLNATTADPSMGPLVAEIHRLQLELDRANESVDDKLDKLEDAGHGVVGLTRKLEDARARITVLEEELARLSRREERRLKRLERARCNKCRAKVDLRGIVRVQDGDESSSEIFASNLPSEPPTPPTRTTEALQSQLRVVNIQLETMKIDWAEEKQQLLGEKAALQDVAKKLDAQVKDFKAEARKAAEAEAAGRKAKSDVEAELNKAKEAIAVFEAELKSERSRLRALSVNQSKAERDKNEIALQLQRTESDMDDVKHRFQALKQENEGLEKELKANVTAKQKARLLEARVAENAQIIEQLREERSLLSSNHRDLQRQFSQVSENVTKLRDKHTTSQTSHDNRRQQLDLQLAEIDELRRALSTQADELAHATTKKTEADAAAAARGDVARTMVALETDLHRVKREAEAFGRDLKRLKAENERAQEAERRKSEDVKKARAAEREAREKARELEGEVKKQKEEAGKRKRELDGHTCAAADTQVATLKVQHSKECKGLIVQIRYLKAKFTRESLFRCDLGYQKQYLLVLLAQFEKSEQRILAAIAKINFPRALPSSRSEKKRRTLRSVAVSITFIARAKRASSEWREQCRSKTAIAAALEEVRKRRQQ